MDQDKNVTADNKSAGFDALAFYMQSGHSSSIGSTSVDAPIQSFRDSARASTTVPIAFIKPAELDGLTGEKARNALRQQLEHQEQGYSARFTLQELDGLILEAQNPNLGPKTYSMAADNQKTCVIIEPREGFGKAEIGAFLTGISANRLNLPGTDAQWSTAMGAHEAGGHCEPSELPRDASFLDKAVHSFGTEVAGDRALVQNSDQEVSAAFEDLRSLSVIASSDQLPDHATKPILEGRLPLNENTLMQADVFRDRVRESFSKTMADTIGVKGDKDAQVKEMDRLLRDSPELYQGVVQEMVTKGSFDDAPAQKIYAQDYLDAYQRTVKLPSSSPSEPQKQNPAPAVQVPASAPTMAM